MLRAMWRELETGLRRPLYGHAGGNPGHGQGAAYELPRQFSTLTGGWHYLVLGSILVLGFATPGSLVLLGGAHQRHFEHAQMLGVGIHQRCAILDLGLPALHLIEGTLDPHEPARRFFGTWRGLCEGPFQPFLFCMRARFPYLRLQLEQRRLRGRNHSRTSILEQVAPDAIVHRLALLPST